MPLPMLIDKPSLQLCLPGLTFFWARCMTMDTMATKTVLVVPDNNDNTIYFHWIPTEPFVFDSFSPSDTIDCCRYDFPI